MRIDFLFFAGLAFLPLFASAQNFEKVSYDSTNASDGYYLSVRPQSKAIRGAVVLLTSFLPPEGLLPETRLHNIAFANDILTIVASTRQKLYADPAAIRAINLLLKDVVTRFSLDTSRLALGGYDEAGNIALRYTELTYEHPADFPVQPKAVFAIDAHVDLFGLWHWSESQIKKNFYPGAVGDARFYLDTMTKENGTIYNNAQKYRQLTPFYQASDSAGNERYLAQVPVRLYYDTDIQWYLKNRGNSYYQTKLPDGSELINRLMLRGNEKAEFISAKGPGMRANGMRHPNALSIVDEVECIRWIKRSLKIFDPNTWTAPYKMIIPKNWTVEHFALPPDFARTFSYKGVEDLRFAPGWGDSTKADYWSYAYVWLLDNNPVIDAAGLQENLKAYYDGLVGRNIVNRMISRDKVVPTTVTAKKVKTANGDTLTFSGQVQMLDYMTSRPIVLNLVVHGISCSPEKQTMLFVEISPKPYNHQVWKDFSSIRTGILCDNNLK